MKEADLDELDTNVVEEHRVNKVTVSDGSIFVNASTKFKNQSSRSIQTVENAEIFIKEEPPDLQEDIVNGLDPSTVDADDKNLLLAKLESMTGVTNITEIKFMSFKENRFDEKFKANTTNIDHQKQMNTSEISHDLKLIIKYQKYFRKELVDGFESIVFQCSKCGTKTSSHSALSEHFKTEHRSTLHLCCRCSQLFMTKRALHDHNSRYHRQSKLSYKCNKCNFFTERYLHLGVHKRAMHPKRLNCNKCKYSSLNTGDLEQHHVNHHYDEMEHGPKVLICKDCNKKFISFSRFKEHARVHSKQLCCLLCKNIFNSQKHLDKHLIRNCKAEHNCKKCGFSAKNISTLQKHKRAQHPTLRYCNQCSYNCTSHSSLKLHKVSNHYDDSKRGSKVYSCIYCNKKFAKLSLLNIHMRGQPCSCILCKYKSNLPRHQNLNQTCHQPRNFSCTLCSKTFVCTKSLDKHLNSCHSKYKCLICSFTTSNKSHLSEHEKFQHKPHLSGGKKIEISAISEDFSTLKSTQIIKSQKNKRVCRKNYSKSTVKETANSSCVSSITAQNEVFICKACNEQFSSSKILARHLIYCKFL